MAASLAPYRYVVHLLDSTHFATDFEQVGTVSTPDGTPLGYDLVQGQWCDPNGDTRRFNGIDVAVSMTNHAVASISDMDPC